jgi:hypothetical protein
MELAVRCRDLSGVSCTGMGVRVTVTEEDWTEDAREKTRFDGE